MPRLAQGTLRFKTNAETGAAYEAGLVEKAGLPPWESRKLDPCPLKLLPASRRPWDTCGPPSKWGGAKSRKELEPARAAYRRDNKWGHFDTWP